MNVCLKQESQSSGRRKETNGESHWAESKEHRNPSERRPSTQPHQVELREVLPSRGASTGSHGVSWTLVCMKGVDLHCPTHLSFLCPLFWIFLEMIQGPEKKLTTQTFTPVLPPAVPSSGPRSTPLSMGGWLSSH